MRATCWRDKQHNTTARVFVRTNPLAVRIHLCPGLKYCVAWLVSGGGSAVAGPPTLLLVVTAPLTPHRTPGNQGRLGSFSSKTCWLSVVPGPVLVVSGDPRLGPECDVTTLAPAWS